MKTCDTEIRVRYCETDAMGIVHHGAYLGWFEVGRVEMMRAIGHPYREMEERGTSFPVIEAGVRYLKPARFDEVLVVRCYCAKVSRSRVRFGYMIERNGALTAHGYTEHAALGSTGRPIRLEAAFIRAVSAYLPQEEQQENYDKVLEFATSR